MPCRNPFSIQKAKPRKAVSRSPLKLHAEDLARELGPQYQVIDALVGNQRVAYDTTHASWVSDGVVTSRVVDSREMSRLEKNKRELEEDNNLMRIKLDVLLDMLAETTAEHELRRKI